MTETKMKKGHRKCPHCEKEIHIRLATCKFCNKPIQKKSEKINEINKQENIDIKNKPKITLNQLIEETLNEDLDQNIKIEKTEEKIQLEKSAAEKQIVPDVKSRLIRGRYIQYIQNNPIYPIKIILNWKVTSEYFSAFLKNNKLNANEIYKDSYREYFITIGDRSVTDAQIDDFLSTKNPSELQNLKPEEVCGLIKKEFSLDICNWQWIYETETYCKWLKNPPHSRISLRELGAVGRNWAIKNGIDLSLMDQECNFFK